MVAEYNALKDLRGHTFGIWKVLAQAPRRDNKTRWLCECMVCGAQRSKRSTTLRISEYTRCDGRHLDRIPAPSPLRKASGYAAGTERYNSYKAQARGRGFDFGLTREQFGIIVQQDCHYCGAPPSQTVKRRHFYGTFTCNGIDRKDSQQGYALDNCVPCCGTCNVMKMEMPYEAFLAHIAQIHTLHHEVSPQAATSPLYMHSKPTPKLANLDTAPPLHTWQERCAAVAPLLEAGHSMEDIAAILNLSRMSAYRAIVRLRKGQQV